MGKEDRPMGKENRERLISCYDGSMTVNYPEVWEHCIYFFKHSSLV